MLTKAQVEEYHAKGFLAVENVLTPTEIQELRDVTDGFVEQSRAHTEHTPVFDLEPDHTAQAPKLRRIVNPASNHEAYNRTLRHDGILDIVSQLFGTESVRSNGNKLNMKASDLGSPVEWHQDWAFYPHTNDDLLAVGVAIDDMTEENGCLLVVPESHKGRIYDHHQDGRFIGAVTEPDFDDANAEAIEIKAGGISIHHVRTLHGSMPNTSGNPRRLFLLMYCAGDAYSLTETPGQIREWDAHVASFLRGEPTQDVRVEPCPVRLPLPGPLKPGSIFENQTVLKHSTLKSR
jgi:phytanoyl-CoA hydroxylase